MEDENIANASANSQSMFQCLDAGDPAFQFPGKFRTISLGLDYGFGTIGTVPRA